MSSCPSCFCHQHQVYFLNAIYSFIHCHQVGSPISFSFSSYVRSFSSL
ncbi:hypothetical protein E2C01_058243 [Portunus trituberculatus]|uniref:Uncharacterized protein n=1 Tax=Portunus trituberculatus TaxID=210409 RepID=A0A5B7GV29_PORTR|nr:hypothetical protein [Portunus trituberculatus]